MERPASRSCLYERYKRTCGPPGGLFGIDQEVVTLTWPLRQLRFRLLDDPDRPASGGINP